METLLVERWMRGFEPLSIRDEASVSVAREAVRAAGAAIAMPLEAVEKLVNVTSELAHNQLAHALGGMVAVRAIERAGVAGLEVVAADRGTGLSDPKAALRGSMRATGSLGVGLAGARELADEMDFDVRIGQATCIRARKFASVVPRGREVGIYGEPCRGERVSGDDAAFVRGEGERLIAVVADGLGHGGPAREAALLAVDAVLREAERGLEHAMSEAHTAASGSRGAVVAAATLDDAQGEVACANVGNIGVQIVAPRSARRFGGSAAVVGAPGRAARMRVERVAIGRRDALVLFTDGVSSRAAIDDDYDLLREPPVVIAYELVCRFGRDHDDALAMVVR